MEINIYKEMVSMSENMADGKSQNFAVYMYTFTDKVWRISNIIEEYATLISENNVDEIWQYSALISRDLEFILAWYAFKYIADEYEEIEISEEQWQCISNGLESITLADDLISLEQVIDSGMNILTQ